MNNEIQAVRNISVIADEINAIKSQTSGILTAALSYAKRSCFEIGKRLEEAKALVNHGEWGAWLQNNFEYSESTAGNLMRIYREFGSEQINLLTGKSPAETFEGLSQSQLVELFALPKEMRAEFVENHRAELQDGDMSIRDMRELIRQQKETIDKQEEAIRENDESYAELVEKLRDAENEKQRYEEEADRAEQNARDRQIEFEALKNELDELKASPKEVETVTETVYEPSKKQIKEIRDKAFEEAEKNHKKETEKLTAELGEKDKLHAKAIEDLQEENMKKIRQLVQKSDPHSARVSYCMEAIGRALSDINAEVSAMEQETPGSGTKMRMRCESSLLGLLNRYGWQV